MYNLFLVTISFYESRMYCLSSQHEFGTGIKEQYIRARNIQEQPYF